jgi:hypothetical protein
MANTALHRTIVLILLKKSGASVAQGDVVIIDSTTNMSFTTTTTSGIMTDMVGVVMEPNGIASNAEGMVAIGGYVPKVNLSSAASLGDTFGTHTVAKQAAPHSSRQTGDFGQVLETGTSPRAVLMTNTNQSYFAAIADQKAAATNGGTFTSGSWQTHTLQTELYDPNGIVSIASDQFTLQAGTYKIDAWAVAYKVDNHQIRLRNITDGATTALGSFGMSAAADAVHSDSHLKVVFTITSAKVFELQHRCETTAATTGFGRGVGSFGENEIFAQVNIEKMG